MFVRAREEKNEALVGRAGKWKSYENTTAKPTGGGAKRSLLESSSRANSKGRSGQREKEADRKAVKQGCNLGSSFSHSLAV